MYVFFAGQWWFKTTPKWLKGTRPVTTYKPLGENLYGSTT